MLWATLGGLAIWVAAVVALWKWVGAFALAAVLLPPFAGHAAVIGYCVENDWNGAAGMLLAMIAVHLMRSHAARLTAQFAAGGPQRQQPGDVIDTVVVESRADDSTGESKRISNDG